MSSQPDLEEKPSSTETLDTPMQTGDEKIQQESGVEPADMSEDDDTYMPPTPYVSGGCSLGGQGDFGFAPRSDSTYGPLPSWKDHVRERQSHRERTEAHSGNQLSKFGRVLKKNRKPEPVDVFMAEMKSLQELETQLEQTETETDVQATFDSHVCQSCGCQLSDLF